MRRCSLILALAAIAAGADRVWETQGFEAFRKGEFSASGANLYVSRGGTVQTVNRWDVNADGRYDLIFNNTHDLVYTPPTVRYRFGTGRRSQPERTDFPGAGSVQVLPADLDGDRKAELVIARGFDNSTRVMNSWIYWGDGGDFREQHHTELSTPYVQDVCAGDFNRDGRADLVFIGKGSFGGSTSYVYWGRADGFFYRDRTGFETPNANGCLAADVDRDGGIDLLITAAGKGGKILWSGPRGVALDGGEPLPEATTVNAVLDGSRVIFGTPAGPRVYDVRKRSFHLARSIAFAGAGKVAAADLDRDGEADLVVTRARVDRTWETSSRIYWGGKTTHTDLPTLGAADVAVADLDRDGFPDIVFANSRSTLSYDVDSWIYWGGPNGYREQDRTGVPTRGAEAVSVLGSDVFFANSVGGRPIGDIDTYVYLGGERGEYAKERMLRLPTIGGYESCTADLNDDGHTDVLLVGSHEGDLGSKVGSYIYWGGPGGLVKDRRTELPTRGAIGCATGDLDRDGYLDLVFSHMEDNTVTIFHGSASGYAKSRTQDLPAKDPRFPSVADLNRDGWLDLLIPSLPDGLLIYWGSATGYDARRQQLLPSVGPVSQQVADLNGDGWLDIVLCNLMDPQEWFFRGINSQIYWGSAEGLSPKRRTELPSLGAHHATVADFNRDGALDIFVSNYQSEFARDIDSHIYWGNPQANYGPAGRQALRNDSAAGVMSADLNGDGWVDLAVSNHVRNGDHHADSKIFWNQDGRFDERRITSLPTIGPHMMTGVDPGNLYTRSMEEIYTSAPYDAGQAMKVASMEHDGAAPFGAKLELQVRAADSRDGLSEAAWGTDPRLAPARRWWQYRVTLRAPAASWPTLRQVRITFE